MASALKLKQLTLKGYRKDYIVSFHDGLNYVSGPLSTGKSTIVEMVNYALGSSKHKEYIEVKASCTDVELEVWIKDKLYKIVRTLFNFNKPIRLYEWNEIEKKYNDEFKILEIGSPIDENSISNFLLDKLDIPRITLSGQSFSFRDLFKYSYVSQTNIDSENILDEKNYSAAFKRKPTLELIFNSLNELLQSLKEQLKEKKEFLDKYYNKKLAIVDFLRSVNLYGNIVDYNEDSTNSHKKINEKQAELDLIKNRSKVKDDRTRALEVKMFSIRKDIRQNETSKEELGRYLGKLHLLRNQYKTESIKLDYLVLASGKLQKIDFVKCPACLNDLSKKDHGKCYLCGGDIAELSKEEEHAIKLERQRIDSKLNKLIDLIEEEAKDLKKFDGNIKNKTVDLERINEKIDDIQRVYISPFIARIEELNREIGELKEHIKKIDGNLKVQKELAELADNIAKEEKRMEKIIFEIKNIEEENESVDVLFDQFSKAFTKTLEAFDFPKLSNAYIDKTNYLPYVRNSKYNDLGSLGAVTLINVAYFLSILKISIQLKKSYHTGLLMLDSISSNLGGDDNNDDEFKDHKIFKSMVKHIITFAEKNKDKVQLIIINNGYTDDIKPEHLVKEFDGDGTKGLPYGLIDDMPT